MTISYVLLALAAMMIMIAGAGIINTLLLNARERTLAVRSPFPPGSVSTAYS
jgi:hypothetical protein